MSTLHLGYTAQLRAIDGEIAKLRYVCALDGSEDKIFMELGDRLARPADDPHGRACQTLRGLLFLKTFIRYDQLTSLAAVPRDARIAGPHRWF